MNYRVYLILHWDIIAYKLMDIFSNMFTRSKQFSIIEILTRENVSPTVTYNKLRNLYGEATTAMKNIFHAGENA